ncbi:septum site-determining protein MinD [Virgibacillus siamensis]|uniref:Septum site-determining protein MinD n=1 Tax=Virgibacillus siamensis TaxID=480071 RepID=A0ABN1FIG0_9BACI
MDGFTTSNRQVVAVCSPTGGLGRTIITANLAIFLAMRYTRVSVMDGDFQFGDLSMAFNLDPELTIKELVENDDYRNVPKYLTSHMTGVNLLAAPKRPEFADVIQPYMVSSVLKQLQNSSDVILIDAPAGFNDHSLRIMEEADMILIVTNPGLAALKSIRLMIETLETLGLKEKIQLVVNRSTLPSVIKKTEVANLTKLEPVCYLLDDSKNVPYSMDVGIPLIRTKPDTEFSKGIEDMAKKLFMLERGTKDRKLEKKGLFSSLKKDKQSGGKKHESAGKAKGKKQRYVPGSQT